MLADVTIIFQSAILGFVGIAFVLAYIAMNLDKKEHGALQVFFAILAYLFLWVATGFIQISFEEAVAEGAITSDLYPLMEGSLTVIIWGGIFFIFYMIIYFIWNLVKRMNSNKKAKAEDPFGGGEYNRL